jgi:multidrug efflux pump subunit AcrA (membrane-fusion protein)
VAAQELEQGGVLARLDQCDFQSQLISAQATFTNAEEAYQRALRLLEGDAISRSEVENRKANRDTAETQLEKAKRLTFCISNIYRSTMPCVTMKATISSTPVSSFILVKTKGRSILIRAASSSIALSDAPT